MRGKQDISKHDKERLCSLLRSWLDVRHAWHGSSVFISCDFGLPPKQMEKIVSSCSEFLALADIGKKEVLKVAKLDLASDEDFADISRVILEWRDGLNITQTLQSQRRAHKKARTVVDVHTPMAQPDFGSNARPSSSTPKPRQSGNVQGKWLSTICLNICT
jgi:hypothetical protein